MIQIKKATVIPQMDGWLLVDFSNGAKKFVDIKPYMNGDLEKLKNPSSFKEAHVDAKKKTVTWPGELALDPDLLYEAGIELKDIKKLIESNKG
ncbi:DUF2442 domain-containing protein [Lysinibacillus sphaericus]